MKFDNPATTAAQNNYRDDQHKKQGFRPESCTGPIL